MVFGAAIANAEPRAVNDGVDEEVDFHPGGSLTGAGGSHGSMVAEFATLGGSAGGLSASGSSITTTGGDASWGKHTAIDGTRT